LREPSGDSTSKEIIQKEKGQSMVELALTITILMALLAGTIDLGRAFFTWLALRDAAQEGASYGSIRPTDQAGMISRIRDNLEQVVPDPVADTTVVITITPASKKCLGSTIQVDVNYPTFPITMPFLGTILGSQTFLIHATVNDTILMPACN
jgi:Flp pilus assembly protein TadG